MIIENFMPITVPIHLKTRNKVYYKRMGKGIYKRVVIETSGSINGAGIEKYSKYIGGSRNPGILYGKSGGNRCDK